MISGFQPLQEGWKCLRKLLRFRCSRYSGFVMHGMATYYYSGKRNHATSSPGGQITTLNDPINGVPSGRQENSCLRGTSVIQETSRQCPTAQAHEPILHQLKEDIGMDDRRRHVLESALRAVNQMSNAVPTSLNDINVSMDPTNEKDKPPENFTPELLYVILPGKTTFVLSHCCHSLKPPCI